MIAFSGRVWRILPKGADPLLPVASPEGRFHHDGQSALYASLTPEGCVVAIRRYLRGDDPPRVIVPLMIEARTVADLRGTPAASVVWQEGPRPAPTWAFSDAARTAGAEAMLYASRSRPELTHVVLFAAPSLLVTGTGLAMDAGPFLAG